MHRSFLNEDLSAAENNEKLEFLGDSVVGLCVSSYLYSSLSGKTEGDLARIKSFVVSEETLSTLARGLGLDALLRMGKGEEQSGGRNKKAILADAMEAVIGAHFLDQGWASANKFALGLLVPEIETVLQNRHRKDYKTIIQEYVQKTYRAYPTYELVRKSGPDHDRTYWISISIDGKDYGTAEGKNKKEAEQAAAKLAYDAIVASGDSKAELLRMMGEA